MIKEVASIDLPVHERMVVRKNRLTHRIIQAAVYREYL